MHFNSNTIILRALITQCHIGFSDTALLYSLFKYIKIQYYQVNKIINVSYTVLKIYQRIYCKIHTKINNY